MAATAAVEKSWANTPNRTARTQKARDTFLARFGAEVDPEGLLDPVERQRRAEHLLRSHMASIRLRGMKAARLKREQREMEAALELEAVLDRFDADDEAAQS